MIIIRHDMPVDPPAGRDGEFNWHANNKTVRRVVGKDDGDGRAEVNAIVVCDAATAPFLFQTYP